MDNFDAVVVGSGPNGLAAAVELTRSGRRVLVVESSDSIGGGTRTAELTLPGFIHDVCSAIHPFGAASPFFRSLDPIDWIHPTVPVTHPLDDGRVGVLHHDLDATVRGLGADGSIYRRLIGPMVARSDALMNRVLAPIRPIPGDILGLGRLAILGAVPASVLAKTFRTQEARAIIAGLAAHSIASMSTPFTGAVAGTFATTVHSGGWPLVRGGSQRIAELMAGTILASGGEIETGRTIRSIAELPHDAVVMLDVMPPAADEIAGTEMTTATRRRMRSWRSGPGVFKIDWALDGPVPWRDDHSGSAGTVHVGGTFAEIAASERQVQRGEHPQRPFVLVAQQSLFDPDRAPAGNQTLWGYCHVPSGSNVDMTDAIEAQIERFAPGFRDRILARHTMGTSAYEVYNPNYVGGNIAGGALTTRRFLGLGASRHYRLGERVYLCSSVTPPGAGVHGMCGYHAARAAVRDRG
jgi:phytoene dehydrogenase-like protein